MKLAPKFVSAQWMMGTRKDSKKYEIFLEIFTISFMKIRWLDRKGHDLLTFLLTNFLDTLELFTYIVP